MNLEPRSTPTAHCWGRTDLFPWHGISSPPWEVSCLWAAWAQLQLTASYPLGWPMWLLMLCGLHVWTLWGDVSTSDVIYISGFIWQGSYAVLIREGQLLVRQHRAPALMLLLCVCWIKVTLLEPNSLFNLISVLHTQGMHLSSLSRPGLKNLLFYFGRLLFCY